jgi:hypothetical protein
MQRNLIPLLSVLIASTTPCKAAVTVTWSSIGGDVIADYTGSLDLAGYEQTDFYADTTRVWLADNLALFFANVPKISTTHYWRRAGGGDLLVDLKAGDLTGLFDGTKQAFGFANDGTGNLYVPSGYVSGSSMAGEARFQNTTVSLIFGLDTFDAVVYDDGVNVITFSTIPESSSLVLVLLSCVTVVTIRSRGILRESATRRLTFNVGFDLLITTDQGMGYQQNLAQRRIGIFVLNEHLVA